MLPSFEGLRDQLLRAGIAPRRVSRYVMELRDHLDDLLQQERASGLNPAQARERAIALLGSEADLAKAMLRRVPSGTLAARAPWAIFVMSPILLWATAILVVVMSTYQALWPVRSLSVDNMPAHYQSVVALSAFLANDLIGVMVAAGCIVIALRQRVASVWVWVGLALIALLSAAAGIHMHTVPAIGEFKGGTTFSLINIVYADGRPSLSASLGAMALRALMTFSITSLTYYVLRQRTSLQLAKAP